MVAVTVQTQYVTPISDRWMFSGLALASGAESNVYVYTTAIPDIVARGKHLVIDGVAIGANIAAGGLVVPGIVHAGKTHIALDTFTAAVGVATVTSWAALDLPVVADSEFVHIAATLAAADNITVAMWGRYQALTQASPDTLLVQFPEQQPVELKKISLWRK